MDPSTLLTVTVGGCLLGSAVGVLLAWFGWRNRDVPVAVPYGLLSLVAAIWGVVAAAVLLTDSPEVATGLGLATRAISATVPPLWFWFAVTYTGAGRLQDRRVLTAVWIVPAAYAALWLTAPVHGLIRYEAAFVTQAGITAPVVPTGTAYLVFVTYAYALVGGAFLLFGWFLARSRNVYRKQTALVVLGSVFPLVGNAAVVSGVLPHPAIEITPFMFAVNGVFAGVALSRYDFLDVTPVANDALVDELPDPVLVLDGGGTIAEHNEAAVAAIGRESLIGEQASSVHPALSGETGSSRIRLGGEDRVYDLQFSRLDNRHGIVNGKLVVLRDVTIQQRRLDRIEALQVLSQQFIEATDRERIGEAAVGFLESELDASFAVVYAENDEGVLWPIAASGAATDAFVAEGVGPDHPLWEYATAAEPQLIEGDLAREAPDDRVIAVPLGASGLLVLGLQRESLADEDDQSIRILRGTMTAAMSRVEREQQLGESRREVDRRTEQIKFFTGVLRHNIRNGMMVIQARTDHVRSSVDDPARQELETVAEWAEDLMDLTEQIGRITDTVTASPDERRRPMDVVPVIERRLDEFEREHNVAVTRYYPETVSVYANDLVGTVIDSLLQNAVTHNDSVRPLVDVSVRRNDDHVQIRIADDGPGIDDDLKESVFERDVGTSQTASGFGLYFVSVMMDFYGGEVWLEDLTEPIGSGLAEVPFEYEGPAAERSEEDRPAGGEPRDEQVPAVEGSEAGEGDEQWGTVAVLQFRRADG